MVEGARGSSQKDPSQASDIESDEETAARQAVAEGQAMVVFLDYSLAPTGNTLPTRPRSSRR